MSCNDWVGSVLHRLTRLAEGVFDALRHGVRNLFAGRDRPLEIVPYRTYGTQDQLEVRGRVLVHRTPPPATASDSWLRNVSRTVRRFLTYEMPNIDVKAQRGAESATGRTDEEGYFRILLPIQGAIGWTRATLTTDRAEAIDAEVLVPPSTARFLVVSDIDDTLLPTGATRTATLIRTTLLGNAVTRAPFQGIVEFYAALVAGSSGTEDNPIFYVSSSPWNLYSFMTGFFAAHGLPAGPVMLRDFGVDRQTFIHGRHDDHKLAEINRILDTYPELPCVLVGDSGQRDPEIYSTVAKERPDRVLAIYVREVGGQEREAAVAAMAEALEPSMIVSTATSVFAEHAASAGLIAPL